MQELRFLRTRQLPQLIRKSALLFICAALTLIQLPPGCAPAGAAMLAAAAMCDRDRYLVVALGVAAGSFLLPQGLWFYMCVNGTCALCCLAATQLRLHRAVIIISVPAAFLLMYLLMMEPTAAGAVGKAFEAVFAVSVGCLARMFVLQRRENAEDDRPKRGRRVKRRIKREELSVAPHRRDDADAALEAMALRCCTACSRREFCWRDDYALTKSAFLRLYRAHTSGSEMSCELMPEVFRRVCFDPERVVRCAGEVLHGTSLSQAAIGLDIGAAQYAAQTVCGDSYAVWRRGDKQYALICDGMGRGAAAARDSREAVELIRGYLGSGSGSTEAITAVNRLLGLCNGESYTTADLCEVDLTTGHARIVKIGAAPSYLMHEGNMRTLIAGALPLGVVDDLRPACVNARLFPGDTLVLVSDGVADVAGEIAPSWMSGAAAEKEKPADTARRIVSRALSAGGRDDMTVVVIRPVRV